MTRLFIYKGLERIGYIQFDDKFSYETLDDTIVDICNRVRLEGVFFVFGGNIIEEQTEGEIIKVDEISRVTPNENNLRVFGEMMPSGYSIEPN